MAILEVSQAVIAEAGQVLRAGRLVAFPTETVYGLGADATNARAVAAIYRAKGRPSFNPLIVHVQSIEAASKLGQLSTCGHQLAAQFWPGPLTLVMPKQPGCQVADLATAGLDTIAVRVPVHPVGRAVIEAANVPIAAPSANRSGHVSPTTAAHVHADLGDSVDMILDGGATHVGLESTVVDVTGKEAVILRLGAIACEDITRALGRPAMLAEGEAQRPASPGMLTRHYAPATRLRLDATKVQPGEALLAFGADVPNHSGPMINLSVSGDLVEAAANLFAALRTLDATGRSAIAVMPIPRHGLGEAINDRLQRGASTV